MTVRDALKEGSDKLKECQIESAYLDSSLLLSHSMGITKEKLFASFPDKVPSDQMTLFRDLIEKRKNGHPVAYLLEEKEFFGLMFHIEEGVLCPRPDTELLVEKVLALTENDNKLIDVLDLCTGTGCIAVSLKANNEKLNVTASDISPIAERVFSINNCSLVKESITFKRSSLFDKIESSFDIIVSNPPYLTTRETDERMDEGWKEPELALDGGEDGLELIRIIIGEAPSHLNNGGYLLIEAHPDQMEKMRIIMKQSGFENINILKDLPGLDRVICGCKA